MLVAIVSSVWPWSCDVVERMIQHSLMVQYLTHWNVERKKLYGKRKHAFSGDVRAIIIM